MIQKDRRLTSCTDKNKVIYTAPIIVLPSVLEESESFGFNQLFLRLGYSSTNAFGAWNCCVIVSGGDMYDIEVTGKTSNQRCLVCVCMKPKLQDSGITVVNGMAFSYNMKSGCRAGHCFRNLLFCWLVLLLRSAFRAFRFLPVCMFSHDI